MVRTGAARNLPKIHTSNYCVAYLDVLGAENYMKGNSAEKFLNDLNSIYFDAISDVSFVSEVTNKDIQVKVFSDNILLAIKINDNDSLRKSKIEKIINLTGNIYNNALCHGYLMRGAITEGPFYKDENSIFVYGKALIDAVEMEEKLAIYPRVLTQKSIQETLPQYFEECADGNFALCNFIFAPGLPDIYKHNLKEIYKKYHKDSKVKQKIMWIISYFNNYYVHSVTKVQITKKELIKTIQKEVQNV